MLQAVGLGLVNSPKERNGRLASVDSQATSVEYARTGAHPGSKVKAGVALGG